MSYSQTVPPYNSRVRQQRPAAQHTTSHNEQTGASSDSGYQLGASGSSSANSFHSHASYVKHQQLKQAAEREAEMYTHYQTAERQRLGEELRRQGPQPVGGPMLSPEELDERRRLKEQDVNNKERLASIQRKKKREEYQQEQRRREQEEIDKKKQIQREKGERLEAKRVVSKEKELEELRMKRLAYFDNDSST
eukprot:Em0021g655a